MIGKAENAARARRLLCACDAAGGAGTGSAEDAPWMGRLGIGRMMTFAGLDSLGRRRLLIRAALEAAAAGLLAAAGMIWCAAAAALPLLVLEFWRLKRLAYRRAESFEGDYTALALSLASAVRTGLDPLAALVRSGDLFAEQSEVRKEIVKLRDAIDGGQVEEKALRQFGAGIDHPDIALFRTALILARRQGSSLAQSLQRLARVTRQRQSFRRKVRGAVAMQKLSAVGIAGCTAVIGLIQYATNPDALRAALQHPLGSRALAGGLLLVAAGLAWMMNLSRTRI